MLIFFCQTLAILSISLHFVTLFTWTHMSRQNIVYGADNIKCRKNDYSSRPATTLWDYRKSAINMGDESEKVDWRWMQVQGSAQTRIILRSVLLVSFWYCVKSTFESLVMKSLVKGLLSEARCVHRKTSVYCLSRYRYCWEQKHCKP